MRPAFSEAMPFHLRARETPADGLRRVAHEELRMAIRTLRGNARESVRVHYARKHLKKLRALLRLVRGHTGQAFFRARNRRLRDLGRMLAPLRDAEVARLTLAQLRRRANTIPARRALAHLRQRVSGELADQSRTAALRRVAAELARLQRETARWRFDGLDWNALAHVITRTYRRAKIEREHFRLRRDLVSLHEWRKRSKDLWYQLLLLRPLARPDARKLARHLDTLTSTQGLMHDVQLVLDALHRHGRELSVWEREVVRELTVDRLAEFTGVALAQGRRVFQPAPAEFAETLRDQPR
jgi:CHAD domain-containing protein